VGSWSERQPAILPKAIWCSRSTYVKPKLRITTLTLAFAVLVGKLELTITTSACNNRSIIDSNSEKVKTAIVIAKVKVTSLARSMQMRKRILEPG
jgi:hypothetical protein